MKVFFYQNVAVFALVPFVSVHERLNFPQIGGEMILMTSDQFPPSIILKIWQKDHFVVGRVRILPHVVVFQIFTVEEVIVSGTVALQVWHT